MSLFIRYISICWQLMLCASLVTSLTLPPPEDSNDLSSDGAIFPPDGSFPVNISFPSVQFECIGGAEYGDAIHLDSCRNAAEALLTNTGLSPRLILEFKDRRGPGGASGADVDLPNISISCMTVLPKPWQGYFEVRPLNLEAATGLCAFEIVVSSTVASLGHARIGDIRRAALGMISACKVSQNQVRGGIARQVGELASPEMWSLNIHRFAGRKSCKGCSERSTRFLWGARSRYEQVRPPKHSLYRKLAACRCRVPKGIGHNACYECT